MLERLARDKHCSLLQKFVNYSRKKFFSIGPGVDLKAFPHKITHHFSKLDRLNDVKNCLSVVKRASLHQRVSKFMPKSFMRSTPAV
jgi:hypothetical protein